MSENNKPQTPQETSEVVERATERTELEQPQVGLDRQKASIPETPAVALDSNPSYGQKSAQAPNGPNTYSNQTSHQQQYQTPPYRTQPYPAQYTKEDNTKFFSIISYVGILWLVGLLVDKDNPVVRFHVNQGIIFSIFAAIAYLFIQIISIVLFAIAHVFAIVTSLFWLIYGALFIAFLIIGILNASKGEQKPLPVIGSLFTILK